MVSAKDRATGTLRAAVVGLGGISQEHLAYLAGRTAIGPVDDRVRIAGVCDLSAAASSYAATTYGAESAHTDLDQLLAEVAPDVVHVLTPPASHRPIVTACLDAGADVICEKPITASRAELDGLLADADRAGRRLMESQNYRFNEPIVAIRAAIDGGELGPVREVELRISLPVTDPAGRFGDPNLPSPIHDMPGGIIHDFTTHFASLLLHLAPGVEFDRVSAAWNRYGDNPLFRFDDLDARLVGDGPDGVVTARLRFDARCRPDTFSVVVRGGDGMVETDLFQPYLRIVRPRTGGAKLSPIVNHLVNGVSLAGSGVRNLGQKLLQHGPYEGLHRMLDLAYTAFATGGPLPVTTADMVAASDLVDRLVEGAPAP